MHQFIDTIKSKRNDYRKIYADCKNAIRHNLR